MCMRNLHETALYEGRHEVKVLHLGLFRVIFNRVTREVGSPESEVDFVQT